MRCFAAASKDSLSAGATIIVDGYLAKHGTNLMIVDHQVCGLRAPECLMVCE